MKKKEDLKEELLMTKIGSCDCFLESMIQEQKKMAMKLKKKGAQEEEVNAGRKGETNVRWASGDWGRHKIRQRQKGCILALDVSQHM